MFINRDIADVLPRYKKFPVIAFLGPRQSGKTTLVKKYFSTYDYVNLENPSDRAFAKEDPVRFLKKYTSRDGLIIDEFQYVPELLSYIQLEVDEKKRPGYFVITGSQNFLMNEAITQTLAGRVGILTLLPLSIHELQKSEQLKSLDQAIVYGAYPRIYEEGILPFDMYPSYIHTYIERDVRQVTSISDILVFQKFMQLCAARIGQEINVADIATNLGVNQYTVNTWLSILSASYILFFLRPYHNNFNKRLVKKPKLYFYDTGLACSLLDIKTAEAFAISSYRGSLFECFIIADLYKQYYNSGLHPSLYFWRDQNDRIGVDCIIDRGDTLIALECKSGETIQNTYFDTLKKWNDISKTHPENNYIIYAGESEQRRNMGTIMQWYAIAQFVNNLYKDIVPLLH